MLTKKTRTDKRTGLEKAIDDVLLLMDTCDHPNSEEYISLLTQLERLYKLKETDIKSDDKKRVSRDTVWLVAGNLAGIVMIVGHERTHVVTSKALSFVKNAL